MWFHKRSPSPSLLPGPSRVAPAKWSTRRQAIVLLAAIIALYAFWRFYYDVAIALKGTVNPLYFALMESHQELEQPPAQWIPKSRIVVSFTTMPDDIQYAYEVLESLGNQTVKPDAIYLNVPKRNKRTGGEYAIPAYLEQWPGLTILRSDVDYGPLTKLFYTLEREQDPDTIIITIDDDRIYRPDTISHLAWFSEQEPNVAWGMSGWSFMWYPLPRGMAQVNVPWWMRTWGGRTIDVLMAVKGIAYRRKFFDDLDALGDVDPDCFLTDDTWISGYLATKAHVPRLVTPGPWLGNWLLESWPTEWYKRGHPNRLSSHLAANKEFNCILAVERKLGPWRELTAERLAATSKPIQSALAR